MCISILILHPNKNTRIMDETCCDAYNDPYATISMEKILYHSEYAMYNRDIAGQRVLDNLIYYQLFECN
jgi:hypothetical protein